MGNINVISIYRYRREENIDMISILIFANIAIPSTGGKNRTPAVTRQPNLDLQEWESLHARTGSYKGESISKFPIFVLKNGNTGKVETSGWHCRHLNEYV